MYKLKNLYKSLYKNLINKCNYTYLKVIHYVTKICSHSHIVYYVKLNHGNNLVLLTNFWHFVNLLRYALIDNYLNLSIVYDHLFFNA